MSLIGQSILATGAGKPFRIGFRMDAVSLVVFNAGIVVFGDAVKVRAVCESKGR